MPDVQAMVAEQAALRRVATLVAQDVASEELFGAVAGEVGTLFGADYTGIIRFEPDPTFVTTMGTWAAVGEHPPAPTRFRAVPGDPTAMVADTGKPARVDDWANVPGPIAEFVRRDLGVKSSVGSPIVVNGSLWGALAVHSKRSPLPPDTESRLGQFTELLAVAIADAEARAEVRRLAEEQAALRRVATLVARETPPPEVFAKISEETANLIGGVNCALCRDEGDGTITTLAAWGDGMEGTIGVGERFPVDGTSVVARVLDEGQPCRIDDYSTTTGTMAERGKKHGIHSAAGCPIAVRGRTWGAIAVAKYEPGPLPRDTERRIVQFAELAATTIANADARAEASRLAEEQAALRRVATLVAEGASPTAVFNAVAAEMNRVLGADGVSVNRYEPNDEVTVVARTGAEPWSASPGTRVSIAEVVRNVRMRTSVWAPIVVEGRLWGAAIANWRTEGSPPADTEERMAKFAELLETAIANADSHDQLTASRARLVTEAHEARRRVVRDLHDGAQQRLVHTIIALKLARRALEEGEQDLAPLLSEALEYAETANDELRELAHGMLPPVLTRGGLRAGVDELAARTSIPVEIDVRMERLPPVVEATAYFVVAEALTNVVKHARAERAEVRAFVKDETLYVEVRDNGVGGANPSGHGLVGLTDRVTALDGRLSVETPARGGTILAATLPLNSQ